MKRKFFETLKERYDECMEYKRSMIIYDLDSLVGVNKSKRTNSLSRKDEFVVYFHILIIPIAKTDNCHGTSRCTNYSIIIL
jgi:hypothetical protein